MMVSRAWGALLLVTLLSGACDQAEGETCQVTRDCASGLICKRARNAERGSCEKEDAETQPDAAAEEEPSGTEDTDASQDDGTDASQDDGTDASQSDGTDASSANDDAGSD